MHGGQGYGEKYELGDTILEFTLALDLIIANTCFKKREEHLITYKSETSRSHIDFFLVKKHDRLDCKDCKVIPGESLTTQHRPVVLDICTRSRKKGVVNKMCPKTRWRDLKRERTTLFKDKVIDEGAWGFEGETTAMWNQMANCIRKVAKEVFGESKGKKHDKKEIRWCIEIQETLLQSLAGSYEYGKL